MGETQITASRATINPGGGPTFIGLANILQVNPDQETKLALSPFLEACCSVQANILEWQ